MIYEVLPKSSQTRLIKKYIHFSQNIYTSILMTTLTHYNELDCPKQLLMPLPAYPVLFTMYIHFKGDDVSSSSWVEAYKAMVDCSVWDAMMLFRIIYYQTSYINIENSVLAIGNENLCL